MNEKQIHVERLVSSVLSELEELVKFSNSKDAGLLDAEAGNLGAIYTKASMLATKVRHVGRAA